MQLENLLRARTDDAIKEINNWVGAYLSRVSTACNKEKSLRGPLDKHLKDILRDANFTAPPKIPMSLLAASQSNATFRDWFQFIARGTVVAFVTKQNLDR